MKVIGLAGWSGAGKTTLLARIIPHFHKEGLRVSVIKHAHHSFDVDVPGKDSWVHRQSGAVEVLVSSGQRWALMHELRGASEPRLNSVEFTMTVDKQDGRRFAGTFSSPRGNDKFVAAISRNNTIFVVDDDGYTVGTVLAPNRMEWCYMHLSQATRLVSCTELTKQP